MNSGQIVALALLAGIANGFARPAAYAGLPNLVSEELLPRANSLLQTADQLTVMLGHRRSAASSSPRRGRISPTG